MKNRTKEIIKSLGIVQRTLAKELGISTVGLQQTMNSEKPRISTIENLATHIGVPAWKLLLTDEEIAEIVREHEKKTDVDSRMVCPRCGAILNVTLS